MALNIREALVCCNQVIQNVDRFLRGRPEIAERAVDAIGLQAGEFCYQCLALRGGEKQALPVSGLESNDVAPKPGVKETA